jgi:Head domain of trimeric autotransporter adhesin
MKRLLALLIMISATKMMLAQNVGIGTTTPNANAALDISSNTKGVLMPRLSTAARNSMVNVSKGMLVYDTTNAGFYYHDGGKWFPISQSNTDSLLRDTYPAVAPIISSMPTSGAQFANDLHGTLYDNGGPSGNYSNNITNARFYIPGNADSAVLIKVEVVEMNVESPYDSLIIRSANTLEKKEVFTGNRKGIFYFSGTDALYFDFFSNGVNNFSGFKINWTKITTNSQRVEAPPLTGFYFNSQQLAARIGVNIQNNWATENLGKYSFGSGYNSIATGLGSTAMGYYNSATQEGSTALGYKNSATGPYSTAFGFRNAVIGGGAMGSGSYNTVTGYYATAIGYNNTASDSYSTAIGYLNKVDGFYATAIGHQLVVKNPYSMVVGMLNDSTIADRIFEIGNGDINFSTRSNAVTVLRNGNTGIGTTTPTTKLDVDGGIRTKYSGSAILNVTGTGSAALVYVPITTLPGGWDFTNTLVMVSVADGISGVIYRTKLVTTSAIELLFEANATGPTRFNYIVFKL